MTTAEQLAAEIEAHNRYHDSGMCYGDSHATFRQEIERLERLLAAENASQRHDADELRIR